jgi:N-acetylmuramoyl-L-alanine amidase
MRANWKICGIVALAAALTCGCGASAGLTPQPTPTSQATSGSSPASAPPSTPAGTTTPASADLPLAGKIVGIDPGHNGGNFTHQAQISRLIWNGREHEACNTTGTETNSGYWEATFNWHVANYLKADLRKLGARVVLTRHSNTGVGPCVNVRSFIVNRAHANVAIDIHADGGPPGGRGFTVLEPVADGPNNAVIGSSIRFGSDVRSALLRYTSMPESDYYGHNGLIFRDDLAGLNLTTVPKILIECGNMRNATDASLLIMPGFQRKLARAFTDAIVRFLTGRWPAG